MGHKQAGDAQLAVQFLDFEAGLRAQLGVQVGQRLVEQKHLGLAHDGAAHGHALALAARQFARLALQQVAQLEDLGGLVHAALDLVLGHLGDLQAIGHVLEVRHVRVERVVLEHHRDVALGGFQVVHHAVADAQFAAGDFLQPRDHAQQRRLAAARGAHDHDELAVLHLGVDAVDDLVGLGPVPVALDDVAKGEGCHFAMKLVAASADE